MKNEKNGVSPRGLGDILCLPAILCGLAAFILYRKNGVSEFAPELSTQAIGWLIAGIAICAASLLIRVKAVRFIAYLAILYAFMGFINSQVTYIANVFVSIDGNTFSAGFLATAVCWILSAVITLIAAITENWRPGGKEKQNG